MRVKSYSDFWQGIHLRAQKRGFPLRVMFELTYRCNFRCGHCYLPKSYSRKYKNELSTQEIFSILSQLRRLGCFYLGFTGGEIFLRRDIFKILRYALKQGFQVILYTNGSLIDREKADRLSRFNLNKIDITIPAMTKGPFERITGLRGSRDKVFKAVELLAARGVRLGFKTCLLKDNQSEIKDIEKFAASKKAFYRLDSSPSVCLDGSKRPLRYRSRLVKGHSGAEKCRLYKHCGSGRTQAAITPAGELKRCVMLDKPRFKILDSSLGDAWERLRCVTKSN